MQRLIVGLYTCERVRFSLFKVAITEFSQKLCQNSKVVQFFLLRCLLCYQEILKYSIVNDFSSHRPDLHLGEPQVPGPAALLPRVGQARPRSLDGNVPPRQGRGAVEGPLRWGGALCKWIVVWWLYVLQEKSFWHLTWDSNIVWHTRLTQILWFSWWENIVLNYSTLLLISIGLDFW